MKNGKKHALGFVALGLAMLLIASTRLDASQSIGKLFIKAASAGEEDSGEQYVDPELEESVKQMRNRPGDFTLVEKEHEAEFLLVVVKRESQAMPGQPDDKRVFAELRRRDGETWKLLTKLDKHSMYWNLASRDVIAAAEKWVKRNAVKN